METITVTELPTNDTTLQVEDVRRQLTRLRTGLCLENKKTRNLFNWLAGEQPDNVNVTEKFGPQKEQSGVTPTQLFIRYMIADYFWATTPLSLKRGFVRYTIAYGLASTFIICIRDLVIRGIHIRYVYI